MHVSFDYPRNCLAHVLLKVVSFSESLFGIGWFLVCVSFAILRLFYEHDVPVQSCCHMVVVFLSAPHV